MAWNTECASPVLFPPQSKELVSKKGNPHIGHGFAKVGLTGGAGAGANRPLKSGGSPRASQGGPEKLAQKVVVAQGTHLHLHLVLSGPKSMGMENRDVMRHIFHRKSTCGVEMALC